MSVSTAEYLLKIIKSVLNNDEFIPRSDDEIDFEQLYGFSKAHHLAGFVAFCPRLLAVMPPEVAKKFRYELNLAVAKDTAQEVAVAMLLDGMERAQLRCMPLKGFQMKRFYPNPALRYMTDTDILIDEEALDRIAPIMESQGFRRDHETLHEVIFVSSRLVVELHKTLIPSSFGALSDYYEDPWRFAKNQGEKKYVFEMSLEDLYVYTLDHLAKHYVEGGVGIKQVMDIYVLGRQELDREYIKRELEKVSLGRFEELVTRVAKLWFSEGDDPWNDETVMEMAMFILSSGAFGNHENRAASRLVANYSKDGEKSTRSQLIFRKIFPTAEFLGHLYPGLKGRSWLYPIYWTRRFFRIVFFRTGEIKKLSRIAELEQSKVDTFEAHCRRVGLSKDL